MVPADEALPEIPYVPCLTPGCGGTLLQVSPSAARALVEYHLRDDPTFQLKVSCDRCGRESRYSLDSIAGIIAPSRRPRPLRADEVVLVLLAELDTAPEMEHRAFLGERILARRLSAVGKDARLAELSTGSALAPSLLPGDAVRFSHWGAFPVGTTVIRAGEEMPIAIDLGAISNAIGCFFVPKADPGHLLAGNVFCSNPSCCMVFALTYSQYEAAVQRARVQASALSAAAAELMLTCVPCGTSRVVDERSFDGLLKV